MDLVVLLLLGVLVVASAVGGSRRFDGFLQQNAVSESAARHARYAGYGLAAVFTAVYVFFAIRLVIDLF